MQVNILYRGRNIVFPSLDVSVNSSLMCENLFSECEVISTEYELGLFRSNGTDIVCPQKQCMNSNTIPFGFGEPGPGVLPRPRLPFRPNRRLVVQQEEDLVQIQPPILTCHGLNTAFLLSFSLSFFICKIGPIRPVAFQALSSSVEIPQAFLVYHLSSSSLSVVLPGGRIPGVARSLD